MPSQATILVAKLQIRPPQCWQSTQRLLPWSIIPSSSTPPFFRRFVARLKPHDIEASKNSASERRVTANEKNREAQRRCGRRCTCNVVGGLRPLVLFTTWKTVFHRASDWCPYIVCAVDQTKSPQHGRECESGAIANEMIPLGDVKSKTGIHFTLCRLPIEA